MAAAADVDANSGLETRYDADSGREEGLGLVDRAEGDAVRKEEEEEDSGDVMEEAGGGGAEHRKSEQESQSQTQRQRKEEEENESKKGSNNSKLQISGLILETPFVSVAAMLPALYPEKWLPYRYLTPFLTNHWDGEEALRKIGAAASSGTGKGMGPKILILQAGRDEVVPKEHAVKSEKVGREVGLEVRRVEVGGALHTEAIIKAGGKRAVVEFLREMAKK